MILTGLKPLASGFSFYYDRPGSARKSGVQQTPPLFLSPHASCYQHRYSNSFLLLISLVEKRKGHFDFYPKILIFCSPLVMEILLRAPPPPPPFTP